MRIIFLDIDGILNSVNSIKETYHKLNHGKSIYSTMPSKEMIKYLNMIIEKTDAKIVISSTWRRTYHNYQQITMLLIALGFEGEVVGQTPFLNSRRGFEIAEYLTRNPCDEFIIIDDDSDMEHLMPHLVKTDGEVGLTMDHVQIAIDIFEMQTKMRG